MYHDFDEFLSKKGNLRQNNPIKQVTYVVKLGKMFIPKYLKIT